MGYLTHWHRDALEADNYLVFEPGDAQVQQIGLHLATQGRVTFADDDAVGIADYLRQRHGCVVLRRGEERYTVQGAIDFLTERNHRVFAPSVVPAPAVRECWHPTRTAALPRWVHSVGADEMSYALERDGLPILIKRVSWDRWVQKTRARRG